jgi:cation diffusion facilitator family transporter
VTTAQIHARTFSDRKVLSAAQQEQERSLFSALWLDGSTFVFVFIAAMASGSLTILAELPRGGMLYAIEIISVVTLCRSHRGKFADFEYGIGKIERVISILIALGLFIAALLTLQAAAQRLSNPQVLSTPAMMLGVAAASYNLMVNFYCIGQFTRANAQENSLILESQIRSRLAKTVASAIVVLVLVIATWLSDPVAATLVDVLGAFFVVAYMLLIGVQLLRESLPELLDRALPEHEQLLLMRVITGHYDEIESIGAIRSRRSGGRAFIELELVLAANTSFTSATRLCRHVEQEVVSQIPDAMVSVRPPTSG